MKDLKKLLVQKLSARKSTKILINFHNEYKDLKKKWKIKKSTMELRMKSFRNKVSRKKNSEKEKWKIYRPEDTNNFPQIRKVSKKNAEK